MNHFTGIGVFIDTYPNEDKSHEVRLGCLCQPCVDGIRPATLAIL